MKNPLIFLLIIITNTARKAVLCKSYDSYFLQFVLFCGNLGLFFINHFTILTVPVSQIILEVKYSISVRYRDTLFCHFSASASYKNIEVIFSYHLPVSKSCPDGNECQRYSNCHCTSSDSGTVIGTAVG
jgi:hypothetical protein